MQAHCPCFLNKPGYCFEVIASFWNWLCFINFSCISQYLSISDCFGLPDMHLLSQQMHHYKFSLKTVLKREYSTLLAIVISFLYVQVVINTSLNKEKLQECIQTIDDRLNQTLTSSQVLTTNLFTATESRLQENLRDQTNKIDKLTTLGSNQETTNQQVSDLLRKMDNSSSKGKVSETMLNHVLHNLYPMGEIKSVGTTKETGDFTMTRDNKPRILFENKNYEKNVGQDEVLKFLRDVETQQCAGILLAQNYGIANKSNYEIHLYQGQVCVYLHHLLIML